LPSVLLKNNLEQKNLETSTPHHYTGYDIIIDKLSCKLVNILSFSVFLVSIVYCIFLTVVRYLMVNKVVYTE